MYKHFRGAQPYNDGFYEHFLGSSPCTWRKWDLLHNPCKDNEGDLLFKHANMKFISASGLKSYCTLTCKSKQSPPLWRHVHRAGQKSSPASVSPDLPEGLLQTGNTPESEGDPPAWTHLPPQDWALGPDGNSGEPAPLGIRAVPLWGLQPPAIPAT